MAMSEKLKPMKAWAIVSKNKAAAREWLREGMFIYPTKAKAKDDLGWDDLQHNRLIQIVITEQ